MKMWEDYREGEFRTKAETEKTYFIYAMEL